MPGLCGFVAANANSPLPALEPMAVFLHYSFIMGNKTLFEDIHLLPPASILRYQDGRSTVSSYWDIPFPERYPHHSDRWYDDLIYNAMQAAVKRMVRPGLRYDLSLSGGLDSRRIAAFLAQAQPESLTFTVGIPGSDDTPAAKEVAARTGLTNHYWELLPTFTADLAEMYTYIVDGMDDLLHMEEFPLTVRVDYSPWTRGPLRSFTEETLLSPEANCTGLFDPDGLRTTIRNHMEGRRDITGFLGRILAIALWPRLFYAPSAPVRPNNLNSENWK